MILQALFIWLWLDSEEKSQREQSLNLGLEAFQREQSAIYERLLESAFLISENSTFKANMSIGDEATVAFSAEFFTSILHVDLFQVFDADMNRLSALSDRLDINDHPNLQSMVENALLGNDPPSIMEKIQFHRADNRIFKILVVPILSPNRVFGAILIGIELKESDLKEFSDLYELFLLIADDEIIHLNTNSELSDDHYIELIERFESKDDSLFETTIDGTLSSARILSIDHISQTLYLIALKSRNSTFYQFIQWYLLFSTIAIFLLISLNRILVHKKELLNSGKQL